MSDVKRYHCYGKDELGYQYDALFREETDGDWVLFSDYDALKARLAEAERERDRMRHGWQRECVDTDDLLQSLGLCPSEYRSDGGSLLLGRIYHKLRRAKELAESRTRAEFLIGMIDARETQLAKATELLKETLDWPVPVSFSNDVRAFLDHTTAKETAP